MLSSHAVAVGWGIWSKNRAAFVAAIGLMPLSLLLPNFSGLFALLSLIALVFGLTYTERDERSKVDGFPVRLYVAPIPTYQLVFWPFLYSVVLCTLCGLFWLVHELRLPIWMLSPVTIGIALYQATCWILAAFPTARVIAIAAQGTGLIITFVVALAMDPDFGHESWEWNRSAILLTMTIVILGYLTTWLSIHWQRSGDRLTLRSWISPRAGTSLSEPSAGLPPFHSAEAAQYWLEMNRNFLPVPRISLAVLIILGTAMQFPRLFGEGTSDLIGVYRVFALVLPIAGWTFSSSLARSETGVAVSGQLPFFAVRPFHSGQFITAKLRAALKTAAYQCLVLLGSVAAFLGLQGLLSPLIAPLTHAMDHLGAVRSVAATCCVIVVSLGLSLKLLIDGWAPILTGKVWIGRLVSFVVTTVIVVPLWCLWTAAKPDQATMIHDILRFVTSGRLPWILDGLLFLKLSLAIWAFHQDIRLGFWGWRDIGVITGFWAVATLSLLSGCWLVMPLIPVAVRHLTSGILTAHLLFSFGSLVFPLFRIAVLPLAHDWGRHQ